MFDSADKRLIAGILGFCFVLLIGGYFIVARQDQQSNKALLGQAVDDTTPGIHVPHGEKNPPYASNPPTSGRHWADVVAGGGIHDKALPDEAYVHAMEHGATIIWYKSGLSKEIVSKIIDAYNKSSSTKKIVTPRSNLDVPIALTSWGRLLKFKEIDDKSLKTLTEFLDTNSYHGPENAPLGPPGSM